MHCLAHLTSAKCFILTMWYVNGGGKTHLGVGAMCFILTMWYVNYFLYYLHRNRFLRFILTMWYVNKYSSEEMVYVAESFILTMWYVNWEKEWWKKR